MTVLNQQISEIMNQTPQFLFKQYQIEMSKQQDAPKSDMTRYDVVQMMRDYL